MTPRLTDSACSRHVSLLQCLCSLCFFFFSSRRRHTRFDCDWSSDVCSSDLTAPDCAALKAAGAEEPVRRKTGLLLDPYFSATKIAWILDHVPGARGRAERGELAFGTVDSFLLWRLTGGRVHATDVTNASRTLLYDIHAQRWDD